MKLFARLDEFYKTNKKYFGIISNVPVKKIERMKLLFETEPEIEVTTAFSSTSLRLSTKHVITANHLV